MCMVCKGAATLAIAAMPLVGVPVLPANSGPQVRACTETELQCPVASATSLATILGELPIPSIAPPENPYFATPQLTIQKPVTRTVTYQVAIKGTITADLATFKTQAQETLADSRGWKRLGITFTQVASGGDFTLWLSESGQVPTFGSICDSQYSCRVGNNVVINQDRWQGATQPWNEAGGNLRDYRHMVVNHEVGHWLGHGHRSCSGAGQAAPVMQQQSISLQGCKFNPWPLDSEMTSSRFRI